MSGVPDRDSRTGLSTGVQHLIESLEGNGVPLSEFQSRHGLVPDGIMGPQTIQVIQEMEYKFRNEADLDQFIKENAGRKFAPQRRELCVHAAHAYDSRGQVFHAMCDKGAHTSDVLHHASFGKARVRWSSERSDGWFRIGSWGDWNQITPQAFDSAVAHRTSFAHAVSATENPYVRRPQATEERQTPDVSKVMVREGLRARKSYPPLTREAYRTRFSEMQYSVVKAPTFGYFTLVTLARGGLWQYRRPTQRWAEHTGARRLRRELAKLDLIYNTDNPQGVRAKDLGIHFQMTSDELTAELAKREQSDRQTEQAAWDAAFNGDPKAS